MPSCFAANPFTQAKCRAIQHLAHGATCTGAGVARIVAGPLRRVAADLDGDMEMELWSYGDMEMEI